jgi:hypothetical protein
MTTIKSTSIKGLSAIKNALLYYLRWIARTFLRIPNRINMLLKPAKRVSPAVSPDREAVNDLDRDDSFDEYAQHIAGMDDVLIRLGLHKRISASHKYMYEMGRRDGALGVSLTNLADIARATAQEIFRHIYIIIKGSLAAMLAEKDTRKGIMEYEDGYHQRDLAYYDYVKYQYRFFPRSYSWGLFVFYLVVAIALIIADIPPALKLIQEGFNLSESSDPDMTFPHLFSEGNFWKIIALNWETVTTAVGIAFCTVYIKIFYDDFIGTPYASNMMTFKRFVEENQLSSTVLTDANMYDDIRRESRNKRIWKMALAIFTVLSIIVLALFRLEVAKKAESFDASFISGAAFVMVTLLFPVIGGICLSHALTNAQNRIRLHGARHKCTRSRKTYLAAVAEYTITQKRYEDLAAAEQRLCDEERMVNEYVQYLVAFYRRGFSTGGMQPEKYTRGEDFYTKILEWRNTAVSRNINHHISKLN